MEEKSEICNFYKGQNVFVTGGTGFLGKILVEKLLRSTKLSTIFILIREKKGKNIHSRLDEVFDNVVFDRLKKEDPKFRHRVVPIGGDCSITGLGISITDRQKLMSEINVVFHAAATVRFDENLKLSYSINVSGTADLIELCRQITNLKALVHVSTAYSNCHLEKIDEKFYDCPVHYENVGKLLEKVSIDEADNITSRILGKWPNTYTFTKALAESLIQKTAADLPMGVYRPSIILSTYKEPMEGWIDNLYGPTGAVAACASGLIRIFPCRETLVCDLVPIDTCVAGLIAAAWDVANRNKENKTSDIPIYNYVSSVENSITWEEFHEVTKMCGVKYPLQKAIWTIKFFTVTNPQLYLFLRLFVHLVPALIVDAVSIIIGQKPQLFSMYTKIHKFSDVLEFFVLNQWTFKNDNIIALWDKMNITDRNLFPLSIKQVPWLMFCRKYFIGIRVHLLGDPLSTLEEARARKKKFDIVHNSLRFLGHFLIISLFWFLLSHFFGLFTNSDISPSKYFFTNNTENDFGKMLN